MVSIKNLTHLVKYKQIEVENHFYEMLTATVSHEMRTPLNSITALLQSLNQYITDGRGNRLLDIIKSSSEMLTYLINDMVDLFQIKNG